MDISPLTSVNGYIKIAAFDHRNSLEKILPRNQFTDFKTLCAQVFSPYVTSILVDPEYGQGAITIARNQNKGILLSREESGYNDDPTEMGTVLYRQFTSLKLKEMGATAIKLLVYYNCDAANAASQLEIVKKIYNEANSEGLPLLVELVTYQVAGHPYHRGDAIIRAVADLRHFSNGLKLEYPIDPSVENIEAAIPYLNQISLEAEQPWVLLSRGMKFDIYKKALKISKENGCVGFAVGRAVWQEVMDISEWNDKVSFMKTTAVERIKELGSLF